VSVHVGPGVQAYGTPWRYVRALEEERGARFDLDVCAEAWSAKAARFIALPEDGLVADWAPWTFCNPPYSDQKRWLARAAWWAEERSYSTACLVRASVDARYWFRLVTTRATCDLFVGRIPFVDPTTRKEKRGGTFASAVVLFGPGFAPGVLRWRDADTGRLIDVRRARELRGEIVA
jgi:phage N-6-adenine-methyltransferase